MALGESHYCGKPSDDVPSVTNDVIRRYLNPKEEFEGWMNTYTKFIRALSGDYDIARDSSSSWWNRILFYNFVQVPMTGARVAPTEDEFRNSDNAFFEMLEKYHPDVVIAWGKRLYSELPNRGHEGLYITDPNNKKLDTWVYRLSTGKDTRVLPITHPSAGFDTEFWHKVMAKFIGM